MGSSMPNDFWTRPSHVFYGVKKTLLYETILNISHRIFGRLLTLLLLVVQGCSKINDDQSFKKGFPRKPQLANIVLPNSTIEDKYEKNPEKYTKNLTNIKKGFPRKPQPANSVLPNSAKEDKYKKI